MQSSGYRPEVDVNSWRVYAEAFALLVLYFGGNALAAWSSGRFGPFYAPLVIGACTGSLLFLGLTIRASMAIRAVESEISEFEQEDLPMWKRWLQSDWVALMLLALIIWYFATEIYPQSKASAFKWGRSDAGFSEGFFGSLFMLLAIPIVRNLLRNKDSK